MVVNGTRRDNEALPTPAREKGPSVFAWPVRVYYEDTDSGGVVYHANYLKFMERARTELLRSVGITQEALRRDDNIIFAVRSAAMEYLKPARFDQLLEATAKLAGMTKASLTFDQQVRLMSDQQVSVTGEVTFCTAQVKIVCLDAATFKPRRMPERLYEEIARVS